MPKTALVIFCITSCWCWRHFVAVFASIARSLLLASGLVFKPLRNRQQNDVAGATFTTTSLALIAVTGAPYKCSQTHLFHLAASWHNSCGYTLCFVDAQRMIIDTVSSCSLQASYTICTALSFAVRSLVACSPSSGAWSAIAPPKVGHCTHCTKCTRPGSLWPRLSIPFQNKRQ